MFRTVWPSLLWEHKEMIDSIKMAQPRNRPSLANFAWAKPDPIQAVGVRWNEG
jgi:hypothetical protein